MFQELIFSSSGGTVYTATGTFLCVLCRLSAIRVGVEQNTPIVVYIVPTDDEQISACKM
jgi:hypothetical protein